MYAITAFLNSALTEELYIKQPEGYVVKGKADMVLCLKKTLYGLKKSQKVRQDDAQQFLKSIGFQQCEIGHYIKSDPKRDKFTAVYVHMDDLAITGNNIEEFKR